MIDQAIIEKLYSAFSEYSAEDMDYCDCGCTDPRDVEILFAKPLRELSIDPLSRYHGSALWTIGDVDNYKFFLPRIFELYAQETRIPAIALDDIAYKLEHAKWLDWPQEEISAIQEFVMADWIEATSNPKWYEKLEAYEEYTFFKPLETLLQVWEIEHGKASIRNFVEFFHGMGNSLIYNKDTKNKVWLDHFITYPGLTQRLEKEFFENEMLPEYAQKISDVLWMIEQEKKARLQKSLTNSD